MGSRIILGANSKFSPGILGEVMHEPLPNQTDPKAIMHNQ